MAENIVEMSSGEEVGITYKLEVRDLRCWRWQPSDALHANENRRAFRRWGDSGLCGREEAGEDVVRLDHGMQQFLVSLDLTAATGGVVEGVVKIARRTRNAAEEGHAGRQLDGMVRRPQSLASRCRAGGLSRNPCTQWARRQITSRRGRKQRRPR